MKPYNAFWRVPPSVPASQPVRYWHHALILGGITFLFLYCGLLVLFNLVLGEETLGNTLAMGTNLLVLLLTLGQGETAALYTEYVGTMRWPLVYMAAQGLCLLLSTSAALYVAHLLARPRTSEFHVGGAELLRGKPAIQKALEITRLAQESLHSFSVWITDSLLLAKKTLTRHVLISGGVGVGKTVLLLRFIRALLRDPNAKSLIYDVKGDITSKFKDPVIISLDDRRGYSIPLGKILNTQKRAQIFMQSIIPDEAGSGSGKFFNNTARLVGVGSIIALNNTFGDTWGAPQLADLMNKRAPELFELFTEHYEKAAQALSDPESKTASDIMATVASYTRIFDELALAWGPFYYDETGKILRKKSGEPYLKKEWNPLLWVRDDYKGKRHVILQGGGDQMATKGYIAAIINLLTPEIVSPSLPDDEEGRSIALILDEFPTIGRIDDFVRLAVAGRSKGLMMVLAYQDIGQIKELYGEHLTSTIESTCGTHLICQVQRGATRDHIAKSFSTRVVGSVSHADGRVQVNGKAVVYPDELTTDLGPRKGRDMGPEGWGIKFIAAIAGHSPLLLTCFGETYPKRREGQVPAPWLSPGFVRERLVLPKSGSPQSEALSPESVDALLDMTKESKSKGSRPRRKLGQSRGPDHAR